MSHYLNLFRIMVQTISSAIKRNKLLHVTTWVTLVCIILEQKKQVSIAHVFGDCIYMVVWKRQKCRDGKQIRS